MDRIDPGPVDEGSNVINPPGKPPPVAYSQAGDPKIAVLYIRDGAP